jgi:predicted MPP superfamily phosphohydrolase
MRVAYIVLSLVFVLDAWWWRQADRCLRVTRRARIWRGLLAVFIVGQALLLVTRLLPPVWTRSINAHVPLALIAGQWLWHLAVLPICILTGLAFSGLVSLVRWRYGHPNDPLSPGTPGERVRERGQDNPSRRQFLSAAAVAVPPLILGGAASLSLSQLGGYRVRSMSLKIPNLPPKLDGLVIAHLSDFHAGQFMTPAQMSPIIDSVNDMNPDLVLITGDLIDYALFDLPPALEALRRLKPKYGLKDGLAMCMGNHDVIENRFKFKQIAADAGFPILINASRTLEVAGHPVQLMAIDWCQGDLRTGEKAPDQTRAAVREVARLRDPSAFPILLAHHPHAFDEAAAAGFPLTLSGHTHGGQIMATPRFGAGSIIFRYWSGLYQKPNGSQLVVSNGIGNWFPLRVNAPAEVARLTLRPARSSIPFRAAGEKFVQRPGGKGDLGS